MEEGGVSDDDDEQDLSFEGVCDDLRIVNRIVPPFTLFAFDSL